MRVTRPPVHGGRSGVRHSLLYSALEGLQLVEKEVRCPPAPSVVWAGSGVGLPTSSGSGDARLLHRPAVCVDSASQLTTEPGLPVAQT